MQPFPYKMRGILNMQLSVPDKSFLDSFEHLGTFSLDSYKKNELNLFMLRINANEFDYQSLITNLLEPIITYSVSRKVKSEYANKPHTLIKKAVSRFVEYNSNTGELGELLLYAFLECHLNAPKILTKLELKTSTSLYVNGSDGVHYLKLPNGNYQLIFGESKTIDDLTAALRAAFTSISDFKNQTNKSGTNKSGINYEKSLISDNLIKETFNDDDANFVRSLIYPSRHNTFRVDDAFGIFVGYNLDISDCDKKLPNDLFHDKIKDKIVNMVEGRFSLINKYINDYGLMGHSFHIYILPFTDLSASRTSIMKELTQ